MAIIYSYPHGTPTLQDILLGSHIDNEGNNTKSFYISDIVNLVLAAIPAPVPVIPSLQEVTNVGASTDQAINVLTFDTNAVTGGSFYGKGLLGYSQYEAGIDGSSVEGYGVIGYSTDTYGIYANSGDYYGLYAKSAVKGDGNSLWTVPSDERLKENILPYTKGLKEILLINTVVYDYNGLGEVNKSSGNIGIIAQEIKEVFPETVSINPTKLNETDADKTDLLAFNGNALTYALINAVKELKAEIELLKAK